MSTADRERAMIRAAQRQVDTLREASRTGVSMAGQTSALANAGCASTAPVLPGYDFVNRIHQGGQGIVYEAVQKATRRTVAIKVMRPGPFSDPDGTLRFQREVHVLAQLQHPNIVAIHDSGSVDGSLYYVMDYVEGRPLDESISDFQWELARRGGISDLKHAPQRIGNRKSEIGNLLRLFVKVCDAVNAAHLRGIIHRDLKPGNILIDTAGEPRILDFGLAKHMNAPEVANRESETDNPTVTGQFLGSLPWVSPEQAEGDSAQIDIRTDVYSLGVVLYQVLTGRFPYRVRGSIRSVLENILHAEPEPPGRLRGDIDEEIDAIVLKCLAKEPQRRYQSAGELARDLQRYLDGEPIDARRGSTAYVLRKHLRRHRLPLAAAAGFVLLVTGSSVVAWTLYASAKRARAVAVRKTSEAERAAEAARRAEQIATERLWDSYLAQARAARSSRLVGRRFESLEALARAAAIKPSLELRNAAIGCLTLFDMRLTHSLPAPPGTSLITFDHTRRRLAQGHADGDIVLWGADDGRELLRLAGFGPPARVVQFSPDGRYIGVKYDGPGQYFGVWALDGLTEILRVKDDGIGGFDFAADGAWVASARADGSIYVYDLPDGRERLCLPSGMPYSAIAVHPDARRIAVASYRSESLAIWDVEHQGVTKTLDVPDGLYSLAWSPDGRLLAAGCRDARVYVWDAENAAPLAALSGHFGEPVSLQFSPRGDLLASSAWDGTSRIWDPWTGQHVFGPLQQKIFALADGFVATQTSGGVQFWESVTGCEFRTLRGRARFKGFEHVAISPDGRCIVLAGEDGLRLWDLPAGEPIATLSERPIQSAMCAADGEFLLTAGEAGLQRWPVLSTERAVRVGPPQTLWPTRIVGEACLLPDGRVAVIVDRQSKLVIFDLAQRRELTSITGPAGMTHIAASPDGEWLVTGNWRGACVIVWSTRTGRPELELPTANAHGAFSPDGKWLIVASGAQFEIRAVGSWTPVRRIPRQLSDQVGAPAAFSPDGRILAVAYSPSMIQLVEPQTAAQLATLEPTELHGISALCFTPDGAALAVATPDGLIQIWDLQRIRRSLAQIGLDWD